MARQTTVGLSSRGANVAGCQISGSELSDGMRSLLGRKQVATKICIVHRFRLNAFYTSYTYRKTAARA